MKHGLWPASPRWTAASLVLFLAGPICADSGDAGPNAGGELGRPFLRNYDYRTYNAHPQNWAVLQTSEGRMLFGNTDGLLEYDGVHWRLILVENSSIVRSLAEKSGTIYVGAVGELGYLERDAAGVSAYVSLTGELPAEERDLADLWETWATEEGVFFWTVGKLFCWHQERFTVRELRSHQVPALVGGKIYNNDPAAGLQVLRGDVFEAVAGGEPLAGLQIFRMLPYDRDTLLIGTRGGELFLFSSPSIGTSPADGAAGPGLRPFATAVDGELRQHGLYGVAALPDGGFALGTRSGGMLVIDRDGALRFRLDKSTGLRDDSVWGAAVDREGGLWMSLNRGLARAEVSSPLTTFGETSGLEGTVESVTRHAGTLLAATGAGVYALDDGRFEKLDGLGSPPCWSLLSASGRLLAGCSAGVYVIENGRGRPIREAANVFALFASPSHPDRVYSGESDGLGILSFENGSWADGGRIEGVGEPIRSIAEDAEGRLWLGTQYRGVIRLVPEPRAARPVPVMTAEIRRFGTEDGLPDLEGVKAYVFGDPATMIFSTADGLYRYDQAAERFVPDPAFRDATAGVGILRLAPDGSERLWLSRTMASGPAFLRQSDDGSWDLDEVIFRRLPPSTFYALYPEPSGVTWLGGVEGLFRYQPTDVASHTADFTVTVAAANAAGSLPAAGGASLPFAENSLSFQFAAQSFHDEAETTYSHRLEGFDADGSPWRKDTGKEYTNLPEGRYRFRVRARNVYGVESEAAGWGFVIQPPWYRTGPAYLAYLAAAALFVTALVSWRSRHLEKDNRALELEIAARTRELQESENKLRLALDGARMAAWVWDMKTDEVSGWEQMAAVLELDPADYGGTSRAYRRAVHPEDVDRFDRTMMAAASGSGGDYEIEHRILRPDGSVGWVLGKGRVLCDDSGRPATMTGVIYDVTARKRTETELASKHDELERFTYSVSHDLKSPLLTIGGFLDLLEQDIEAGAEERVRRDLERISSAVGKMRRLLDELLELSRVGRLTTPPEAVPVAELVSEALELVALTTNSVELDVGSEMPEIWGDRTRLVQVFQNLIDNALKFLGEPSAPRIEIDARGQDGQVLCWVADNGIGIDPDYHDKVFGLFERLDTGVEGTGIGLALAKRIVEHHGGRMWVESPGSGKGSTFYFTLPALPILQEEEPSGEVDER